MTIGLKDFKFGAASLQYPPLSQEDASYLALHRVHFHGMDVVRSFKFFQSKMEAKI
jgi:hypothetical protein